tara:strand:+ start:4849 stop:5235 length:387 start_codon:yes stop_codon:yes gene_type:complete
MYEDSQEEGFASHIPFIPVPEEENMPQILYIFESRETGEFEPGPEGEDLPVTEMELHQYADMNVLKTKLDLQTYDKVRTALGLEPMQKAVEAGQEISNNVRLNLGQVAYYPDGTGRKRVSLNDVVKDS